MAGLNINPTAIGQTLASTAIGKLGQSVGQAMSPKMVKDVQRVLGVGRLAGQYLGIKTGVGLLDSVLGLNGGGQEVATPLLGGLSFKQAQEMSANLRRARPAQKNLWFIRITDENLPPGVYQDAAVAGSLGESRIGAAAGEVTAGASGIAGAVSKLGAGLSSVAESAVNSLTASLGLGGPASAANSIGRAAIDSFDMLAIDVAYSDAIAGDSMPLGGSFIDKPTGLNQTEFSITMMDDEAGSIKRWYDGKKRQVAHKDGTMGLPAQYVFDIEIVHAIASPLVANEHLAYRRYNRVRVASAQFDLSRRDAALSECQLVFAGFDDFM